MKVYVASSWRCERQPNVVTLLHHAGIECYDFRNPPNGAGFGWEEVIPSVDGNDHLTYQEVYLEALEHQRSVEGFNSDFAAMVECDACVLVLPCGRSAHLELGWFVGQGKPTAILLDGPLVQPELMYKMVDHVSTNLSDLIDWVRLQAASPGKTHPQEGAG